VSERIPTDVLVEEARTWLLKLPNAWPARSTIAALADRLDELAALEPVGELLAAMREQAAPDNWPALEIKVGPEWNYASLEHIGGYSSYGADTPAAALAALAEAIGGRA
jgi:hypothetical protein